MTISFKRVTLTALFGAALVLTGCGGGGGTTSGTPTTSSAQNTNATTAPFVLFSPSAATLAAKKPNSALTYSIASKSNLNPNQGCASTISNTTVYEQTHTAVFAAAGVTEAEQQEVAEYAEAAVVELRSSFSGSSTPTAVGFNNEKLYVCIQTELYNGSATAGANRFVSGTQTFGNVVTQSPSSYFNTSAASRSSLNSTTQQYQQNMYRRVIAHEALHVMTQSRTEIPIDWWMTEGMARHFEFGKSAHSLAEITSMISTTDPLNFAGPGTDKDYFAAAAVVAYLYAPNGANNPASAYANMLEKIKTAYFSQCINVTKVPSTCPNTASEHKAFGSSLFVAAFESSFKEKDGTPMRLYMGTNSLKSTLASRIAAFW